MTNPAINRQVIDKDQTYTPPKFTWAWKDEENQLSAIFYTQDNYKDWLRTKPTDLISDSGRNKLTPAEYLKYSHDLITAKNGYHDQNIFILDLDATALIFEHFTGGNLIMYGNTDYFIDDISNPNILNEEPSSTEINYMLDQLYKKVITEVTTTTTTDENNKIVLRSKGINSAYSTLAISNNNCQCYLYNLRIENTLTSGNTIKYSSFNFIEQQSVILFWPCMSNVVPTISNPAYVDREHNYTFRSNNNQGLKYKFLWNNNIPGQPLGTISGTGLTLNISGTNNELPEYLTIDTENAFTSNILTRENRKINSTQLKNILYNTTGNTPFTTLVHWGYVTNDQAGNLPFLSDFNPDSNDGFMLSPKCIAKYNFGEDVILDTDYSTCANNVSGHWAMYVYEIQHANEVTPLNYDYLSGTTPWKEISSWTNITSSVINPPSGEMRVNVKVYYTKKVSNTAVEIVGQTLLPTANDLFYKQAKTIPIPNINPAINLLFFGKADLTPEQFDVWHGGVRNVLVFNTLLSHIQLETLFKYKLKDWYDWLQQGEFDIIKSINRNSCIGCTYVHNTDNLNVYDCVFKSQINSLNELSFQE